MGLPWNVNASMGGAGVNDQILRSLRFRSSASAYLTRTPSVAGSQTTWTWSGWVKRGAFGINGTIFGAYTSAATYYVLQILNNETLQHYNQTASSITAYLNTTQVFRDPSAWYHIVAVYNSTNATASNRMLLYVNGVQITTFSTSTYPSLNANATVNSTSAHDICRFGGASNYFDGYLAEVNFIDGQALTPASFGYNDPVTGVWQPAPFKGTYGTNGFYLPFTDIATTSGSNFGLGRDYSGNSNYWNTNNISVTAGTTYDSMIDSPTNFSDGTGIYNRGNYCVLNPIAPNTAVGSPVLSNGNLTTSYSGGIKICVGTHSADYSGSWYYEAVATLSSSNIDGVGWTTSAATGQGGAWTDTNTLSLYAPNGQIYKNGWVSGGWATYTTGDVIGVAWSNGTISYYKNNVLVHSYSPSFSTSAVIYPCVQCFTASSSYSVTFGQRPFTYTPPTGYKALNTFNLATPTIANGAAYMAATLYTGNGGTQSISNAVNGVSFQPDFVWAKNRTTGGNSNVLMDSVRGITGSGYNTLFSDVTVGDYNSVNQSAWVSTYGYMSAITSTGFTMVNGSAANANFNSSSNSYVGWQWKAGGTGVTNTSGTITSTVSANTTAGFSVVTYTGTAANATVGHGLGVAPDLIITKNRDSATDWWTYHSSLGATKYIVLNSTAAAVTSSGAWNNTAPTSSVFSLGSSSPSNANRDVAYCFAAVRGYSAFGSYTGNGSATDGPFIYTGFRPRFLILKRTDAADAWVIEDSSRDLYNVDTKYLLANASDAEASTNLRDLLSNGFKMRSLAQNINGGTYIYMAFAENPFNYSRAR